jgi:RNA polymerase sigma factor (sigma-70 family)
MPKNGPQMTSIPDAAEPLTSLALLNRRYRPALIAFFLRRVRNHADAEDLTHEVFLRVAAAGGRDVVTRPDAYVFQTAANLLRDRGRRDQVRAEYRQDVVPSHQLLEDQSFAPERIIAGRESLSVVLAAMQELSSRARTILILYRIENMSIREIGDLLDLSTSAVEKHIIRATLRLRDMLRSSE